MPGYWPRLSSLHVAACRCSSSVNWGTRWGTDVARNQLTAAVIKRASDGKHQDGGGLILVKKGDRGKWVFRYSFEKRRREMGLGAWPDLSLAAARQERDRWAEALARGSDPMVAREAEKAAAQAEREKRDPTLTEMMEIVFEAKKDGLRGGGDRGRWKSPLTTHVLPKIGNRRISSLTQHEIYDTLKPIWRKKHPTAEKAIQRLRIIFDEARYMGLEADTFTIDAAKRMLGEVRHVTKHIVSTPWQDVPALWKKLDPSSGPGLCLRWMLLTMVRFDGCRAARVSEVDDNGIWTVPADRVKGRVAQVKDFRVPLPGPALEIVETIRRLDRDLMFVGHRGKAVSSRGVEVYLDRIAEPGRPHGFRSSFRSWVQDTDACSFEVAETILGHKIGGTVERSYARSDLLERRAPVMEAWAAYVTGAQSNVVNLKASL